MRTSAKHVGHRRVHLALRPAKHLEPERDIAGNRHVRKQRVVLEHGVDRALERRQRRNVLVVEQYAAAGGVLKAGNEAQQRGLAAALTAPAA
jgi:hypothetical protein